MSPTNLDTVTPSAFNCSLVFLVPQVEFHYACLFLFFFLIAFDRITDPRFIHFGDEIERLYANVEKQLLSGAGSQKI